LGEDIKEKLIPRAIDWFTGEALQFEEVDDEMEEGDFEDEVSIPSISAITKKG
jgi:nucleosome assembly protein 1-like 1